MTPDVSRMPGWFGAWLALAAGLAGACGGSDESARSAEVQRDARATD